MSSIEEQLSNLDQKTLHAAIALALSKSKTPMLNVKRKTSDSIPSHALIYWQNEHRHSILNYKNIELEEDLVAQIDKIYNVKFNSSFHQGKVVLLGTKIECEKHLELLTEQEKERSSKDSEPKTSSEESSTKKINKKESAEIQTLKNKHTQVKDELDVIKVKLLEFQKKEKEWKQTETILKQQIKELTDKNEQLSNTFNKDDKEKLIKCSRNFLEAFQPGVFGNKGTLDTVLLHPTCPSIYVPSLVYIEAAALLKCETTTTSSVIRTIMNSLIKFDVWAKEKMNYTNIKEQFPNECAACVAFITSIRNLNTKADMLIFSETIGQMCVDARKKKGKKEAESE